jgi:hypothetical protein
MKQQHYPLHENKIHTLFTLSSLSSDEEDLLLTTISAPKVNETDADAMIARTKALVFQTLLRVVFIIAAQM